MEFVIFRKRSALTTMVQSRAWGQFHSPLQQLFKPSIPYFRLRIVFYHKLCEIASLKTCVCGSL